MDDRQLAEILAAGAEQFGVEFKGPGKLDGRLKAQLVRAVLGFANRRDGGVVVIGVAESGGGCEIKGLTAAELGMWTPDAVADTVAAYAAPSVSLTVSTNVVNGKSVVVIRVAEFADVPVLCRKSYDDVLGEGQLYVRGRRKPETTPVRTEADMRDLLELAIEKRLRSFVATTERARLRLTRPSATDDRLLFERQGREL